MIYFGVLSATADQGHVLADDSDETPMIPDQLILASKAAADGGVDPVILAVQQVFFLAQVQLDLLNRGRAAGGSTWDTVSKDDFLSPFLAVQILWWFRRWSLTYLMPDDRVHAMISANLWQVWGEGQPFSCIPVRLLLLFFFLLFIIITDFAFGHSVRVA